MEIKTKFDVGDTIRHRYAHTRPNQLHALIVMEVVVQVCYTTTQIFYDCRVIAGHKFSDSWDILPTGRENPRNGMDTIRYREDELMNVSPEVYKIIQKGKE